jgi:hypothetical protein
MGERAPLSLAPQAAPTMAHAVRSPDVNRPRTRDGERAPEREGGRSPGFSFADVAIYPKPTVGESGDALEQEADLLADRVMRMASPAPGSAPAGLHGSPATSSAAGRGGSGQPLPDGERRFYESRLGWDFSEVRVHADAKANARANALGARAFTMGSNILLGAGAPSLGTDAGRRLVAHELAHVIQQQTRSTAPAIQRQGTGKEPIRPVSTVEQGGDGDLVSIQGHKFAIIRSRSGTLRHKGPKQDAFFELPQSELLKQSRPGVSLAYTVSLEYENPQDDLSITFLAGKRDLETTVFPAVNINVVVKGDQSEPEEKAPPLNAEAQQQALANRYTSQALALARSLDSLWRQAKKLEFEPLARVTAGAFGLTYGTGENVVKLGLDVIDTAVGAGTGPPVISQIKAVEDIAAMKPEAKAIGRHASESVDIMSGKTNEIYEATRAPYEKFKQAFSAFNNAKIAFNNRSNDIDGGKYLGKMESALKDMQAAAQEYKDLCAKLGVSQQAARLDDIDQATVTGIQRAPETVARALMTADMLNEFYNMARPPLGKGLPGVTPKLTGEAPPAAKPKLPEEVPQVAKPATPTRVTPEPTPTPVTPAPAQGAPGPRPPAGATPAPQAAPAPAQAVTLEEEPKGLIDEALEATQAAEKAKELEAIKQASREKQFAALDNMSKEAREAALEGRTAEFQDAYQKRNEVRALQEANRQSRFVALEAMTPEERAAELAKLSEEGQADYARRKALKDAEALAGAKPGGPPSAPGGEPPATAGPPAAQQPAPGPAPAPDKPPAAPAAPKKPEVGADTPGATTEPKPGAPGSKEHREARWKLYQERGGKWPRERWDKVYDNNMKRAKVANKVADDLMAQLGWGEREVTVDVEGVERRLDIADEAAMEAVEVKSGYQTATQENLWEVARDEILKRKGWDIRWYFKGTASAPLLKALDDAKIPYTIVP